MNTPNLNDRRKLLREALAGTDANDVAGFAAAFAGAGEDDRAALARTLPAAKLFKSEGPTPRACFVLAALGKPAVVVETIRPRWIESNDSVLGFGRTIKQDEAHAKLLREAEPVIEQFFLAASGGRDRVWRLAFIDALVGSWLDCSWSLIRALVTAHALAPESEKYLGCFLNHISWHDRKRRSAEEIAALLTESNGALLAEFWALFRVEGVGGHWPLIHNDELSQAIVILCDTVPGFRERILDESLNALLRDFSAKNSIWYPRIHRAIEPTVDEIAARADRYHALLAAGQSTTVALAQDMLARAISRIDADALLDASAGVLGRAEKKLLTAQIKLLAALVKAHPKRAAQVGELVAGVVDALPVDVAAAARKLIPAGHGSAAAPAPADSAAPAGAPVAVAEPRRAAIAHEPETLAPIDDENELWQLVAACLEGVGHGPDLPRILDCLERHAGFAPSPPLQARAAEILTSVWDKMDASPRRHLADLLLARAGQRPRQFKYVGYRRIVFLRPSQTQPPGTVINPLGYCDTVVPTHMPTALLVAQFDPGAAQASATPLAKLRQWLTPRHASAGQFITAPLPATVCEWQRVLLPPGKGYFSSDDVLGMEPKPVWLPVGEGPTFAGSDLGLGNAQDEYTLRAEEAREQDGFDQIVQWAGWFLAENPDTLAAIYHPALDVAVRVVNVRGIGALLAALGATRQVPHGPAWSALALGLSAKMPEHRAAAAEAVAALAESGLLDPAPFAAEIAAHLKDGFVLAGRLAAALGDVASISPIAGYRALQTLAALLPHLDGVPQSAKLPELAARLATDYGGPIRVPDALTAKRKGNSVMAVALRALESVTPRPAPLAKDAAAQAAKS